MTFWIGFKVQKGKFFSITCTTRARGRNVSCLSHLRYEDKARGLVGTAIRKTLQQVETVADAARDAARRRSRRRDTSGRALSESDLDSLIWPRLFGTDDWVAGGDKSQAKQSSMKGCPSHSLLAELAVTMALATAHGGGPQAAATLWDEVIEDIEFNYWQVGRE